MNTERRERPILFKDDMIRAILAGRKTQTRRILDVPQGWSLEGPKGSPASLGKITSSHPRRGRFGAFIRREIYSGSGKFTHDIVTCKYGEPGDRLWVRETFADEAGGTRNFPGEHIYYRADGDGVDLQGGCWKPSIHMPRWASRITLEITDVRVERLQDISIDDAKAEGSPTHGHSGAEISPRKGFRHLWGRINGHESWDANPWVWVIEFKRISPEAAQ